jgi:hypothetical protein
MWGYFNPALVKITHKPTGIVVQCVAYRHQHKNRMLALKCLKAKLYTPKPAEADEVKFSYVLDDDFDDNLDEYKREVRGK